MNGIAATLLAECGYPIFPCEPGSKKPLGRLVPNGHKDATRNINTVTEWWVLEPHANIAMPVGEPTGVVVLDVDQGGEDSLIALEREAGTLPRTFIVQTGGGGRHLYFLRPPGGLRNSAGRLSPGLDMRGDGGYVLLPTSRTKDSYSPANTHPIAPLPNWLRELLTEPKLQVEGSAGPVSLDALGQPIFKGSRNVSLTSVAGRLRAQGHNRAEIAAHLHLTNEGRCRPMLSPREIERIASSISRYPAGRARPVATAEVRAALDRIEAAILSERWPGTGGGTDRGVVTALVVLARSFGTLLPAGGVRVSISRRDLALLAGVRHATITASVQRLRRSGWLTTDNARRERNESGALILKLPQGRTTQPYVSNGWLSGTPLRDDLPALRHGPGRLGKRAGEVIEALVRAGGAATVGDLCAATGIRRDNLRRRYVGKLEEAGIAATSGETVHLLEDWREKLDRKREFTGEKDAARADELRYEREREAFNQQLREEKLHGRNKNRP